MLARAWCLLLPVLLATGTVSTAQEPYWQCSAFARQFSGIAIRADALNWWNQAEGRFLRGYQPRVGAVMAFVPSGNMRLGHVATVTGITGPRDLTVTHANWSPIGGVRGQIERDVMIRDVSTANDWSQVRVWYAPLGDLGTTAWPVRGFIYPQTLAPIERVPQLTYARLDTMEPGEPRARIRRRPLLSPEVIRLASLEAR